MKKRYLSLLAIFSVSLLAQPDTYGLDDYHKFLSNWLMDKSDYLDKYISEKNDTKRLSNTRVKVAYEVGVNTSGGFSNNLDFGLSLNLPRFENKVKLTLNKVKSDWNALDENGDVVSNVGLSSKLESDNKYDLMLEYKGHRGKKSSIGLTGGLRFNKYFFEPYVGLKGKYLVFQRDKDALLLRDKLRFYVAGEIRNTIYSKYVRDVGKYMQFGWYGNIDYSTKSDNQDFKTELLLQRSTNNYSFNRVGFVASANLTNFKNFRKQNFETYYKHHDKMLNKDWLYYEITPSVVWKKEDNFKSSFTLKFKIGATFGGIRK